MREADGQPLLAYVLDGLSFIPKTDIILVVGYKKESVQARFAGYTFAVQQEQLGTGHAVMAAESALAGFEGAVLVCCGDMPLLTRETYSALAGIHFNEHNDCTLLTSESEKVLPFGRIIRDASGGFREVVEDRDCTPAQKAIRELNTGVYIFDAGILFPVLRQLRNNNAQGEYYLTDVPAIMRGQGRKIGICKRDLGNEIIGVNTLEQLREVEVILRGRTSV
jgi:bifunctional N-acetylglucosamine-1-phosphate-uridyltransferase/glucosamine-1-phosphate-acetyltransferase GlmU-like protein